MADRGYIMAKEMQTALLNATYNDENTVAFTDGFPRIIVVNWTEVKTVDKNLIHAAALANNYQIDYDE